MTTNESLLYLAPTIKDWFDEATASGDYNIPITAENIKTYNTAPNENSTSPNWVILHGVTTESGIAAFDAEAINPLIAIILLTHFEQTEASKEAAERWLNDAEEVLVLQLAAIGHNELWHSIETAKPRRDIIPPFHGKYRTSSVLVTLDMR